MRFSFANGLYRRGYQRSNKIIIKLLLRIDLLGMRNKIVLFRDELLKRPDERKNSVGITAGGVFLDRFTFFQKDIQAPSVSPLEAIEQRRMCRVLPAPRLFLCYKARDREVRRGICGARRGSYA